MWLNDCLDENILPVKFLPIVVLKWSQIQFVVPRRILHEQIIIRNDHAKSVLFRYYVLSIVFCLFEAQPLFGNPNVAR